ncbi:peptidoglycan-binding protein [Pseudarthrobacter sp. NPDC092424]|uniref:peptidoglycan-binding protein n=1 Tax=Pseudarthrobacter sp. NPDC092424 TaxID=3364415 RepID=UPI00381FF630
MNPQQDPFNTLPFHDFTTDAPRSWPARGPVPGFRFNAGMAGAALAAAITIGALSLSTHPGAPDAVPGAETATAGTTTAGAAASGGPAMADYTARQTAVAPAPAKAPAAVVPPPAPAVAGAPDPAPAPVPASAPAPPPPAPAPAPAPAVRTIYVAGSGGQELIDACIGPIHFTPNDGYSLFITEHDFCGGWARFSGIAVGETVSLPGYGTYTVTGRGQVPNPGTTNDVVAVFGSFPRAILQTCIPGTSQMLLIALN